ncbi:MAG TPA: ceramidase domain-containing protein [Acidimicrobiia bacterium]|nr:ceramidase domain-containing protein [Acidimicrobiia bacterium]
MRRHRDLIVGLVATVAVFTVFALLSRSGYPGGPDECLRLGDCYCEAPRPGIAAQPANAWSNLGFVLIGLLVLADSARTRDRYSPARIEADLRYSRLFGAVAVFLGLGSFAFHGSLRAWGGYVDVQSMHAFLAFVLAYDLTRIHDWRWGTFLAWFGGLLAAFSLLIGLIPPEHGRVLFGVVVAITIVVEVAVSYPTLRPWAPRAIEPRRMPWFWAGLGAFAVAFVIWNLSRTGGAWCEPASLLQGHALWHLLSAVSVGCFYLYFGSEGPRTGSST